MLPMLGVALIVSLSAGAALADPIADARAKVSEVTAKAAVIETLAGMYEVDQEARSRFLAIRKDATPEQRVVLDKEIGALIEALDLAHEKRLQAIFDAQPGWFPISVYGQRASAAAMTIVNHSNNIAFRKEALKRMEPLIGTGDLTTGYANVYDRTAVSEGRPQRYGTQDAACVNGAFANPTNVENPAALDARRATLKLGPMTEYLAGLTQIYGRCDGKPGGRS